MQNNYDGMQLKIIESTLEVVGEMGLENLTIRKVSHHADISLGIIHHHFQNKENLIYCTYDYLIRRARAKISAARSQISDPVKRMKLTAELCFIPALTSKGATNVWPQMWSSSVHDNKVRRLCSAFSKRLVSNLQYDFRRLGFNKQLANTFAIQTSALIHGIWIEQSILGTVSEKQSIRIIEANINHLTSQVWCS